MRSSCCKLSLLLFSLALILPDAQANPLVLPDTTKTSSAPARSSPPTALTARLDSLQLQIHYLRQEQELITRSAVQANQRIQRTLDILTFFFIGISAFVALFAGWATYRQSKRENAREAVLMSMQQKISQADIVGANRVSEVMRVVHLTLRSRLLSARKQEKIIGDLQGRLNHVDEFIKTNEKATSEWRKHLEAQAKELAQASRHEFRRAGEALRTFQREFDIFKRQHPFEAELSGRSLYVRGISALLSNETELLEGYLKKVIALPPEEGEEPFSYSKRLSNAFYYLGLHHSNFGELTEAVHYLEQGCQQDLQQTDVLTRLVMAETYAMAGQNAEALRLLDDIDAVLANLAASQGTLRKHQLRFKSRGLLIRANSAFLRRQENWLEEMQRHAEAARGLNGRYYYATLTLAQIKKLRGEHAEAQELFRQTYQLLKDSGDLQTNTEKRIRILLNMVCGLCCLHGEIEREMAEDYLNAAETLRKELPRIGVRTATVFSPLSKKNESNETIGLHLALIRRGEVLLHGSAPTG